MFARGKEKGPDAVVAAAKQTRYAKGDTLSLGRKLTRQAGMHVTESAELNPEMLGGREYRFLVSESDKPVDWE